MIVRRHDTINKLVKPWSKQIHYFLAYLWTQNFKKVPEPFGIDESGQEVLSFVEGNTFDDLKNGKARAKCVLISSAKLLRAYHDASSGYLDVIDKTEQQWMFPARYPNEVICHNDYAPYNICYKNQIACGIIDFETASPGPRVWDIAYALYRFAPLTHPNNDDGFGSLSEQIVRARLFLDAYGLDEKNRLGLVDVIIERLETLCEFMMNAAKKGEEKYIQNINDGHHLKYLEDIRYIKENEKQIQQGLLNV